MSTQGENISHALVQAMNGLWDGRTCIMHLHAQDYNWRQMEWIGFYFELRAREVLVAQFGGGVGPTHGNVTFDYQGHGVWDFKAHPDNQSSRWIYLNDVEAVQDCIRTHGHLGWVIGCGTAVYDEDGSFKAWHDALKGKQSDYEARRILRGARSRKRKATFALSHVDVVEFRSLPELDAAVAAGWLRDNMQERQRNADGSPRRPKYGIKLPEWRAVTSAGRGATLRARPTTAGRRTPPHGPAGQMR